MDANERLMTSLEGLSVGDAFGQQFFWHPEDIIPRRTDVPPWKWTDDTEMAVSICRELHTHGTIDPERLAQGFLAEHDPRRCYGAAMVLDYFPRLSRGQSWQQASQALFDGQGSFGNGTAMRAAPIGAYFADDLERTVHEAATASAVTHAHAEGIAGGVAVAVAAAIAVQQARERDIHGPRTFLREIIPHVPEGRLKARLIELEEQMGPNASPAKVAEAVGNGSQVTVLDTVPFCLWMAGRHLDDYPEALWNTVREGGDIDTTCAIVGGIVASFTGVVAIPTEWRMAREPLPRIGSEPTTSP